MYPNFIKELLGFSGSKISLMKKDNGYLFVRKEGNITRNYEKLKMLSSNGFAVPIVYDKTPELLDMEYIEGLDMVQYLQNHDYRPLVKFIVSTMNKFKESSILTDYTDVYSKQLSKIDYSDLPFSQHELFCRLPAILPKSLCHGDFTFENIIYSSSNNFVMIDCSTGDYDSWIFDLAKLRQDLDANWFLRNNSLILDLNLPTIKTNLKKEFPEAFDDNLYILMLLRVYTYCQQGSKEHYLLLAEIQKIWK
jgi:hypothetical protein